MYHTYVTISNGDLPISLRSVIGDDAISDHQTSKTLPFTTFIDDQKDIVITPSELTTMDKKKESASPASKRLKVSTGLTDEEAKARIQRFIEDQQVCQRSFDDG